jgi:hypothetical protein
VTAAILDSFGSLMGGGPVGLIDAILAAKAIGLIGLFILQHHPHHFPENRR